MRRGPVLRSEVFENARLWLWLLLDRLQDGVPVNVGESVLLAVAAKR